MKSEHSPSTPASRGRKRKADAAADGAPAAVEAQVKAEVEADVIADVKAEPGAAATQQPAAVKQEPLTPLRPSGSTRVRVEGWAVQAGAAEAAARKGEVDLDQAPTAAPLGPFPDFQRPLPEECQAARDALAALHGEPDVKEVEDSAESKVPAASSSQGDDHSEASHQQRTVLDSLVRTILSQNTTDTNSVRAFKSLKAQFPAWESVRTAPEGAVEEAIRCGGLADIKTQRIKVILNTLLDERGECTLEYLRELDDEAIKTELTRFKGVGKKTVACVLMFCLRRKEFPVDTHVWRISKSLGWVPAKATRDQAYDHLNLRVPDSVKYDLHVLLVRHGKRCPRCAKNGQPRFAADGPCPLTPVMLSGGSPGKGSSKQGKS